MTRSTVLLYSIALLLGCVSATVEPSSGRLGEMRPGEAIAVLLNGYQEGANENKRMVSSADAAEIEQQLGHCLAEALRTRAPELRVVEPSEFAERVFPSVPLQRVPRSPESIVDLASNPEFRARTHALGVRFIVIATGATQMPSRGGIGCFGGAGAGACLGLVIWDRDSQLAALVLDLESGKTAQGPSVTTSSHAWFAMLGIFPLGMPSGFTKTEACRRFGSAVAVAVSPDRPAPATTP